MSMSERTPLLPSTLQNRPPFLPTTSYDPTSSEHSRIQNSHSSSHSSHFHDEDATQHRDDSNKSNMESRSDVNGSNTAAVGSLQDPEDGTPVRGEVMDWRSPPLELRVREFFTEDVRSDRYCQAQLLLYTFATGIIDLTTLVSYGCFATKQTGNTVFLAMRLAQHPYVDEEEVNIYFSFGFFLAGITAFSHGIVYLTDNRPRMRLALFLSALIQTSLTWIATALVYCISDQDDWPVSAVIMAILAVQAGGQINMAFQLGQGEMNTTMVTGGLISFCRDQNLLKASNTARDRRAIYFGCFGLGCFAGSGISKFSTPGVGFLVYAVMKTVLAFSFLLNHREVAGDMINGEEEGRRRRKFGIWKMLCGDV